MSILSVSSGLLDLPWWGYVLAVLCLTHITIVSVTIYLHRQQAHRALDLHPAVSHFFRFWLWLTTGMVTREWVAIHRKHHAKCETRDDPHSPQTRGIRTVLWQGAELYRAEASNRQTLQQYGHQTPDDWLERRLYARHPVLGVVLMLCLDVLVFGVAGIAVWGVQMLWIPFWAAGVINGLGHWWGYRNFETVDASTNISLWGILIGGEELHNNHHAFASSAKFSVRRWEFDLGWAYIRLLSGLGLARVRRLAPTPYLDRGRRVLDLDGVRAVFANRLHVMTQYARQVIKPVLREEAASTDRACRKVLQHIQRLMIRDRARLDDSARGLLESVLGQFARLRTVYQFREQLQSIWSRPATSHEHLLAALQDWCARAESTGVRALQDFSRQLKAYSPAPA